MNKIELLKTINKKINSEIIKHEIYAFVNNIDIYTISLNNENDTMLNLITDEKYL